MSAPWRPAARWLRRDWAVLVIGELITGQGGCAPRPDQAGRPDASAARVPAVTTVAPEGDPSCLRALENQSVAYKRLVPAGGMHTPVEVMGPIGGVTLAPRGRSGAVMDCVLASALRQASGVFDELGIEALSFSAAFDNRTRRGSTEASAHAYGLAIDVHSIRGRFGEYEVRRDFERNVGRWNGLRKGPGALEECIGQPTTTEGRLLRRLACRLKLHPAFRVIITPDDDADHQDHLHLEAAANFFPPAEGAPPIPPPRPAPPRAEAESATKAPPARNAHEERRRRVKEKPSSRVKGGKEKRPPRKQKSSPIKGGVLI